MTNEEKELVRELRLLDLDLSMSQVITNDELKYQSLLLNSIKEIEKQLGLNDANAGGVEDDK